MVDLTTDPLTQMDTEKLYPEKELTQKIIGCAFEIYNQLGYGLPGKVYQRAAELSFKDKGLIFQRELYGKIEFNGQIIGRYYLDFLVENIIAVEFKVRNEIFDKDISQLLGYMKSKHLLIGLLILFSKDGVKIKRLIN
jgi:GxxExxY protein